MVLQTGTGLPFPLDHSMSNSIIRHISMIVHNVVHICSKHQNETNRFCSSNKNILYNSVIKKTMINLTNRKV